MKYILLLCTLTFSTLFIYVYIQIYKEYPSIYQYKHLAAAVGLTDRYLRPIPC